MRQLAFADSLVRRFAVMVMLTIAALFFAETALAAPMPSAKELRAALFHSDGSLQEFTAKVPATEFFPDATGYGAIGHPHDVRAGGDGGGRVHWALVPSSAAGATRARTSTRLRIMPLSSMSCMSASRARKSLSLRRWVKCVQS